MVNKKEIEKLRNIYTVGSKVVLDYMDDTQAPPKGTIGTITYVDDIGNVHVTWENGSQLALLPDIDLFRICEEVNGGAK